MTISTELELELTAAVRRDGLLMLGLEAEPDDTRCTSHLNQPVASSGMTLEALSQLAVCHRKVGRKDDTGRQDHH